MDEFEERLDFLFFLLLPRDESRLLFDYFLFFLVLLLTLFFLLWIANVVMGGRERNPSIIIRVRVVLYLFAYMNLLYLFAENPRIRGKQVTGCVAFFWDDG